MTKVKEIMAGYDTTVVLKEDGTIVAWGHNDNVRVFKELGEVKSITVDGMTIIAIKKDGTILGWGGRHFKLYSTPSSIRIGDLNRDGQVNSIDFAYMRQYLLGMIDESEFDIAAADVDASGKFNSIDFAYMRQYLLGMIDELPAELN